VPTDERAPTQPLRLTENSAQDGLPAISPDGKWIAFVSDVGGRWRIWVVPLDGGEPPLPIAEIRGTLLNWLEHSIQWVAN
jgi:Tol biopolymer transport system component